LLEAANFAALTAKKAFCYAAFLAEHRHAVQLLIRAAQIEAERILREHESILRALVIELLAHRTMTGNELAALIKQAPNHCMTTGVIVLLPPSDCRRSSEAAGGEERPADLLRATPTASKAA